MRTKSKPLLMQLLVERIDQNGNSVESQAFAFVVEVEVGVVDSGVPHRIESLLVRLLDRFLVTRFVDQIDEVLISVERDLLAEVTRQRLGLS